MVVWSPQYQHDIDAVEAVQRRATWMVPVLRHLDYESRLKVLNLPTYHCLRGDVIDVYKYLHGILHFRKIYLIMTYTKAHRVIL